MTKPIEGDPQIRVLLADDFGIMLRAISRLLDVTPEVALVGVRCDSELHRDDQLLSATWIRGDAGSASGKCIFHDAAPVALGVIGYTARPL